MIGRNEQKLFVYAHENLNLLIFRERPWSNVSRDCYKLNSSSFGRRISQRSVKIFNLGQGHVSALNSFSSSLRL